MALNKLQSAIDMLNMLGGQYVIKENGCWEYTGKMGSGRNKRCTIVMGTKGTTAGRVICTVVNGPPPRPEFQAGHSCYFDDCINPSHFQWESADQNQVQKTVNTGYPTGIRPRGNKFEARVRQNGKNLYKFFYSLKEAIEWRSNFMQSKEQR